MKKLIGAALAVLFTFIIFTSVCKAEEGKTYKVAIMCCDDFNVSGSDNIFEEYMSEYLLRLSTQMKANFEYDFIKPTTSHQALEKYDIYVGISANTANKINCEISGLPVFTDYLELWTLAETNTYAYNDFDKFKGMKVGYVPEIQDHIKTREILEAKELDIEFVEIEAEHYEDYYKNFKNKGLDAIIGVATRSKSDFSVIARLERQTLYLGTTDADIKEEVDEGMQNIEFLYPVFRFGFLKKYYGDSVSISQLFTESEKEYINKHPNLNVYIHPNSGYLSIKKGDEYVGIEIDLLREIAKIAGFKLNIIDKIAEDNLSEIDIFSSLANAEKLDYGYYTTEDYLQVSNYIVINKNTTLDKVKTVALVDGDAYTKKYASKMERVENIHYYENIEKCLEAVLKGEADATFSNGYILQYYLQYAKYKNLELSIIEKQTELEFYINTDRTETLKNIINKCIAQVGTERIQDIVIYNTTSIDIEKTPWEKFKENKFLVGLTIITIVVIIIIFIVAFYSRKVLSNDLKRAQFATKAKSDFLSRMSHDIRTPLNAIIGFNEIAREENDNPQVEANLEKISTSSKYLLGLINDILDMSKIESGKLELNAVSTNSLDFLNDIASVFYELARMKGIRLTTDFSDLKTVWVEMDSLRARQVYANLLNNAIKFSEAGTVINWTITDTILDDYRTERVVVIEDQGRGMSQKFMKTMFDPFEQEEDEEIPNDESGTGLGLSIVRNILDLTGSKIDVQSEIGKGTKFTITIIRKHGTPVVQENKENEEKENLCEGKRLLLFEDHPLNRQIMSKILEKKNIIVEEATNGKEGVDMFIAANEGYYDVIFMDISMPIMNGYEATKAIRSLEREDAKNVPIIAITANAFTDDVEKCIECGMNQHISKPIDVNRVYAVLEEVLRK